MLCPVCDAELVMENPQAIDVEYCEDCYDTHGADVRVERFLDREQARMSKTTKRATRVRADKPRGRRHQDYRRERQHKSTFQNQFMDGD